MKGSDNDWHFWFNNTAKDSKSSFLSSNKNILYFKRKYTNKVFKSKLVKLSKIHPHQIELCPNSIDSCFMPENDLSNVTKLEDS